MCENNHIREAIFLLYVVGSTVFLNCDSIPFANGKVTKETLLDTVMVFTRLEPVSIGKPHDIRCLNNTTLSAVLLYLRL